MKRYSDNHYPYLIDIGCQDDNMLSAPPPKAIDVTLYKELYDIVVEYNPKDLEFSKTPKCATCIEVFQINELDLYTGRIHDDDIGPYQCDNCYKMIPIMGKLYINTEMYMHFCMECYEIEQPINMSFKHPDYEFGSLLDWIVIAKDTDQNAIIYNLNAESKYYKQIGFICSNNGTFAYYSSPNDNLTNLLIEYNSIEPVDGTFKLHKMMDDREITTYYGG